MSWNSNGQVAREGDWAQLVSVTHKSFIFCLKPGIVFQTHRGAIRHDDLIGTPWGSQIESHMGSLFVLIQPSIMDMLDSFPRNTQVLYPKDIGYILFRMSIGPEKHVLEAGTGSGVLTSAFAFAVGAHGKVYTYDSRHQMRKLAAKNLKRLDLQDRVVFHHRDIADGFEETDVDAVFLDVPNPYDYIDQVKRVLKPGGYFGSILPTINQVARLVNVLQAKDFTFVDICEILLRNYKVVPERMRPVDRMVAHTGYLIFGRPMIPISKSEESIEDERQVESKQKPEEITQGDPHEV